MARVLMLLAPAPDPSMAAKHQIRRMRLKPYLYGLFAQLEI
jgi:hypothetical protein